LFHNDSTAISISASRMMRAAMRRVIHTRPASHSGAAMGSAAVKRHHPSPTSAAARRGRRATG
jgi:hypothetical protein